MAKGKSVQKKSDKTVAVKSLKEKREEKATKRKEKESQSKMQT